MVAPLTRGGSTWLITPASLSRFETARSAGADVALLDLEDSVPQGGKESARAAAIGCLTQAVAVGGTATVWGLRLNAPGTVHGLRDLVAVAESGVRPAILLVPKVESPRDIELVAKILDADDGPPRIWALIETPRAIGQLPGILGARSLAGVVFGAADYAAATGCRRSSHALWYPRSALAAGAAAAGLPAIDSPYFDINDADGLRREAEEASDLGFTGKGAVHPRQLLVIREAFRPSAQELAEAQATLTAAETAGGVTAVGGRMVGPPLVAAARAVAGRAGDARQASASKEVPHG
ncbi:CoA ester lyase [Streptomyces sp. KLMMK]|uniref:HpcH/HpaI aldolase/citrate lyase family protein n=1 Tax=Streptomyces sp. KLMMK TaxID=3109353 RepID=UPI00300084CA